MAKEIFISYSRKDFDKVKAIKDEIDREIGIDCWMDLDGIESGEQFEDVIISSINSHDTMLFMLSPNSMDSEYALDELNLAKRKQKRIVLVYVEQCEMTDKFYFQYSKYDTIEWNNPLQRNKLFGNMREWFSKSAPRKKSILELAEQGDPASQYLLGQSYSLGKGVKQDYVQAVYWYRKAAERGNKNAQYQLGYSYKFGYGVKPDSTQAVYWFQYAAEQGNPEAQYLLGQSYSLGKGATKNVFQAFYWYQQAAEQGHIKAQIDLGYCYEKGNGVEQDYVQAVYWYRKAAEQGDTDAMVYLGDCYEKGNGVKQDNIQAAYWYKKAAEQGDEYAINWLKNNRIII